MGGEEGESFDAGLRDQHSVEGVAMQGWQLRRGLGMLEGDGERLESEAEGRSRHRLRHTETPERLLDCNLPNGCGAQIDLVRRIADGAAIGRAQPAVIGAPPEKNVSVNQEPHFLLPSKAARTSSGSGASKSGPITTRPFHAPGRRGFEGLASGTNLARGSPALAMTISSPPAARSTSSERCVLAS